MTCADPAEAAKCRTKVRLEIAEEMSELYIETTISTGTDSVRAITWRTHDNIVRVEHAPFSPFVCGDGDEKQPVIRDYTLADFIRFAREVPADELGFLRGALEMNRRVYERASGDQLERRVLPSMICRDSSLYAQAKRMAGVASYARMSGVPVPVMTATGSGNQGLTLFLTIDAAAEHHRMDEDTLLRALALGNLVNIYVKSFIGPLSSVCACGVASGLGASLGVVFMLGGGEAEMLQAARNILGSVSGMICDGAKEGCASKVALSAGLAVEAACLAMEGAGIQAQDGILDERFEDLIGHLGELVLRGMGATNRTIVHIMKDEKAN